MALIEVCVDTAASLDAAVRGGAGRIELCADLTVGGLSPSAEFMAMATACPIPVYAMIRPCAAHFRYDKSQQNAMAETIVTAAKEGLDGIVIGAESQGQLDHELLASLLAVRPELPATLHRVVDEFDDPTLAVEPAISLGFERILTSGGAETAKQGIKKIKEMREIASGRIAIMPGAGITAENIGFIAAQTGCDELHGSFAKPSPVGGKQTCETEVRLACDEVAR